MLQKEYILDLYLQVQEDDLHDGSFYFLAKAIFMEECSKDMTKTTQSANFYIRSCKVFRIPLKDCRKKQESIRRSREKIEAEKRMKAQLQNKRERTTGGRFLETLKLRA